MKLSILAALAAVTACLSCPVAAQNTPAPTGPPCYPTVQWPVKAKYGVPPVSSGVQYEAYAVWTCNEPTGYLTTAWLFNFNDFAPLALKYAVGAWSTANALTDCLSSCVAPTSQDSALMASLISDNRPVARVSTNGAATTRSVFGLNPDGTLNPTPLANSSVTVGTPCDERKRVGTNYYNVAPAPNAKGGTLPPSTYAICSVSFPIPSN